MADAKVQIDIKTTADTSGVAAAEDAIKKVKDEEQQGTPALEEGLDEVKRKADDISQVQMFQGAIQLGLQLQKVIADLRDQLNEQSFQDDERGRQYASLLEANQEILRSSTDIREIERSRADILKEIETVEREIRRLRISEETEDASRLDDQLEPLRQRLEFIDRIGQATVSQRAAEIAATEARIKDEDKVARAAEKAQAVAQRAFEKRLADIRRQVAELEKQLEANKATEEEALGALATAQNRPVTSAADFIQKQAEIDEAERAAKAASEAVYDAALKIENARVSAEGSGAAVQGAANNLQATVSALPAQVAPVVAAVQSLGPALDAGMAGVTAAIAQLVAAVNAKFATQQAQIAALALRIK